MGISRVVSLERALSKLGFCSRKQGRHLIEGGRVSVNGRVKRSAGFRVDPGRDQIAVDGRLVAAEKKVYLALNKPRGLVTTLNDEQGRETVYSCFAGADLPWVAPVGRLDKASEGLLLFSNDSRWGAAILDPSSHLDKMYHVQVDQIVSGELLQQINAGIKDGHERLDVKRADILRRGSRYCWLEIVLDQGRNRQIRRVLDAFDIGVLRLVRVQIGSLTLGDLAKGEFRHLDPQEKNRLTAG